MKLGIKKYLFRWEGFPRHMKQMIRQIFLEHTSGAQAYYRTKQPDPGAEDVRWLQDYQPAFAPEVEEIVNQMAAAGSHVVLLTLPGLYSMDSRPTPHTLEIGHLPLCTNNPYVLAQMTAEFNDFIRDTGQKRNLQVIDLALWQQTHLAPADEFFIDSVHLTESGQELVGYFIASQLAPTLTSAREK